MDDEYYVDGVDGFDAFEELDEDISDDTREINRQKELIAIVKVNPQLWDKRQKGYCAKNKELAWAAVAAVLGNMSGPDAEKEFYKIRQKYGKERRKVLITLKGKSGQSTQLTYVSTWELYEICDSFLRTVIIPRKTSSNYMKTAPLVKSNESDSSTEFQVNVPQTVKPSLDYHYITVAGTSHTDKTPDFYTSLSSDTICDTREEIRQQVLQTISQTTAKKVPPSDTFNKRKGKLDEEFTEAYIKQSERLNNLAQQISQRLVAKNNPEPAHATVLDPIVGAIHLALTNVKDAEKFQCMLDVLQYINEKYVKNNKSDNSTFY